MQWVDVWCRLFSFSFSEKRHISPVPSRSSLVHAKPKTPAVVPAVAPGPGPGDTLAFRVPKDYPHSRFSKAPLAVYPPKGARSKSWWVRGPSAAVPSLPFFEALVSSLQRVSARGEPGKDALPEPVRVALARAPQQLLPFLPQSSTLRALAVPALQREAAERPWRRRRRRWRRGVRAASRRLPVLPERAAQPRALAAGQEAAVYAFSFPPGQEGLPVALPVSPKRRSAAAGEEAPERNQELLQVPETTLRSVWRPTVPPVPSVPSSIRVASADLSPCSPCHPS